MEHIDIYVVCLVHNLIPKSLCNSFVKRKQTINRNNREKKKDRATYIDRICFKHLFNELNN